MTIEFVRRIKPRGSYLLVERVQETREEVTPSGLVVTLGVMHVSGGNSGTTHLLDKDEEADDNLFVVKVVAAGPEAVLKVGESLIMAKYSGMDILKDRSIFMILEKDILGKI